jgi:micrococcal nuclease
MSLGKSGERSISRGQAILGGIFLLLFPLCCLLSAGYRLVNGAPPDFQSLFAAAGTDEATATREVAAESAETPLPSNTAETGETATPGVGEPTLEPSVTLPAIPEVAACVPTNTPRMVATVIQVIDGDEIRVRVGEDEFIVRYIGIVAPQIADPLGPEASNENVGLVLTKQVTLVQDVTDRDAQGKLPRYVFVGDAFVNLVMVEQGLAMAENLAPDLACSDLLQAEEATAQAENAGLWETPLSEPTRTLAPAWTATSAAVVCSCTGPDLNCGDFASTRDARECYLKCLVKGHGDVYDLDPDDNGIACDE